MSLEESSKGSLRFDEFPTSVKTTPILSNRRATRLLASKRKTVRVSSPAPKKPARKDSAACVSLSSNHNVKEPAEKRQLPPSEPPMETNPQLGVNGQARRCRRRTPGLLRFCPRVRAVAYNPAGCRNQPARRGHLSRDALIVKGSVTLRRRFRFSTSCDLQATFLPECAATLDSVNGEVTIRG